MRGVIVLSKFKFNSSKKNKFNFFKDSDDVFDNKIIGTFHTEIFSNKQIILEGCRSITDYQNDYIKLKVSNGYFSVFGNNFVITTFDNQRVIIKGNISSIQFSI